MNHFYLLEDISDVVAEAFEVLNHELILKSFDDLEVDKSILSIHTICNVGGK